VADIPEDLEQSHGFPFRPGIRALSSPSWSADGRALALGAAGHTGLALTIDDQGRNPRIHVLNYEGGVGKVLFAPTGQRLAVESRPASGFGHLLVVDPAAGSKVDIGSERLGFSAFDPTWAPNGAALAALVVPGGLDARGSRELVVFGVDGAPRSRAAAGDIQQPAWSPRR
jgi:hypothetical protein